MSEPTKCPTCGAQTYPGSIVCPNPNCYSRGGPDMSEIAALYRAQEEIRAQPACPRCHKPLREPGAPCQSAQCQSVIPMRVLVDQYRDQIGLARMIREDNEYVVIDALLAHRVLEVLENTYGLGLLVEEMGEAQQAVGKWLRFGPDVEGNSSFQNARHDLTRELGDVKAAIRFSIEDGMVDEQGIATWEERKATRLADSRSKDAQGQRLAPQPRGLARYFKRFQNEQRSKGDG